MRRANASVQSPASNLVFASLSSSTVWNAAMNSRFWEALLAHSPTDMDPVARMEVWRPTSRRSTMSRECLKGTRTEVRGRDDGTAGVGGEGEYDVG